jgi:hypothetical protein
MPNEISQTMLSLVAENEEEASLSRRQKNEEKHLRQTIDRFPGRPLLGLLSLDRPFQDPSVGIQPPLTVNTCAQGGMQRSKVV